MMRILIAAALVLLLLAALTGCAGKGTSTPEAATQAFLAAVKAGDADKLSKLYDYVDMARSKNPDWDSIPKGQRDLIIGKVAEERAGELKGQIPQMQKTYENATVGTVKVTGDQATVILHNAPGASVLSLVDREGSGGWWGRALEGPAEWRATHVGSPAREAIVDARACGFRNCTGRARFRPAAFTSAGPSWGRYLVGTITTSASGTA